MNKSTFSPGELADLVDGELIGKPEGQIRGVSSIEAPQPETVVFVETEEYMEKALSSEVALIIAGKEAKTEGKPVLRVENPRLVYARIARLFAPAPLKKPGIHPTAEIAESAQLGDEISIHPRAVVCEGVQLGDRVVIGPGVYLGPGVTLGDDTILHPNVVIEYDCQIGSKVIIHSGTVVGSDGYGYVTDEDGHHKIPQLGKVIIEDNVEIGANTTIDRGTQQPTIIRQGSKIDNLVQIAHNVEIGEESLIVAQVGIAGSSSLGKRVTAAGQVGIVDHVEIGENATLGARSLVTSDVPEDVFYSGSPAREHRSELREKAAQRKLPDLIKEVRRLKKRVEKLEGSN